MELEQCSNCGETYELREIGAGINVGNKMPEEITCPYCRYSYTKSSNGGFITCKHENNKKY